MQISVAAEFVLFVRAIKSFASTILRPALFTGAVLACSLSTRAVAAEDTAALTRWIQDEIRGRSSLDEQRELFIKMKLTMPNLLKPAEIEKLQKEIASKPDHPGNRQLVNELRKQANGADVITYSVWWKDAKSSRVNSDSNSPERFPFNDVTVTPNLAWQLNSSQLTVVDPREGWPAGYPLEAFTNTIRNLFHELAGSLGRGKDMQVEVKNVRLNGDAWSALLDQKGYAVQFKGTWDAKNKRGFVSECEVTKSEEPDSVGSKFAFEAWKETLIPGLWVSSKVTEFGPNGRVISIAEIPEVRALESGDFDRVSQLPDASGSDPLRGTVTVSTVKDYRPGIGTETYPKQVGSVPKILENTPRENGRLQTMGWVFLGVLVVGLVGLRVRSMSKSSG